VWCQRFGTQIAAKIRHNRPVPADKWHLDEVVISIRGRKHWLWRAVDANGDVLQILMQSRRNAQAAKRFLMKLMKRWGVPRVLVPPSRDIAEQCTAGQWTNCAVVAWPSVTFAQVSIIVPTRG
jgi:transposase-like protein